jgi:hypothetical protein
LYCTHSTHHILQLDPSEEGERLGGFNSRGCVDPSMYRGGNVWIDETMDDRVVEKYFTYVR